jgi:hypothetical protein
MPRPRWCYLRLFGRCVSADAAADFAAADAFGSRSTADAALPAFLPVCSFLPMAVSLRRNAATFLGKKP